ncbi:MAG TPA: glycosyltransferase 87 family protein [Flavisolibacter sp.]|nr:glycosyltransferase 87 family protein [Flavisolibacter sp.]
MIKVLEYKRALLPAFVLLTAICYYWLSYVTIRENFIQLVTLFTILFSIYFCIYKYYSGSYFKSLIAAGILFRILLLFSVPHLSDDVYRFIWDGRLAANGINPFSHLPSEVMQMPPITGVTNELYQQLNSPGYYTIYPPVLQGIFWLAGILVPENVFTAIIFLKIIVLLFEAGVLILLIHILKKISLPRWLSLLYFLNPLMIVELTGNVHFEGVMIFFVLLSLLLLLQNKWRGSAVFIGFAIATKIIPALFLPLLIRHLGWKKGLKYCLLCGLTTLVLFLLLFDATAIHNLLNSIELFFRRFEFNASLYYIVRWVGTMITGYNIIGLAGPVLSFIAACIIVFISFGGKEIFIQNFFSKLLFIITVWFLFATTVHPWYICMPVALAVITPYRYPLVWSFTVILSYAAYQTTPVKENLWLVAAGYFIWMMYAFYELKYKAKSITVQELQLSS